MTKLEELEKEWDEAYKVWRGAYNEAELPLTKARAAYYEELEKQND